MIGCLSVIDMFLRACSNRQQELRVDLLDRVMQASPPLTHITPTLVLTSPHFPGSEQMSVWAAHHR